MTLRQTGFQWPNSRQFAVTLAILIGIAFPAVALGWHSFVFRDFGLFGYPFAFFHKACFWRGELPLWNPYNNCGIPHLAQWNTLVLYPGSLIYLVLPLPWSLGVFELTHLWLGGMGAFFLARHLSQSPLAGGLAGVAYACSGLSDSCLIWPHYVAALAWMPWILYSLRRAWAGENRFLLAAILCGSCQMMTGAPELILASWGISLGFGLGLWLDKQICFSGLAWRSLLVVCSVAGLSAMQILPFLDLLQASVRDSQFANNKWAMPATGWANFFVPMAFTQAGTNGIRFPTGQDFVPSYYLGIGTCVLAITALIRTKRNSVRLPGFFAALAVVMALGDHGFLHPILKKLLPWLGVSRYPVKYLFFTLFAMPILVAEAIHLLGETPDKAKRCLWTVGAGIFCVVMGVTWFAFRYPQLGSSMDDFQATFRSALQSLLWLSAFLACLAWLFSSVPAIDAVHRWSAPTACILVGLDLLTHAPNINPTIPSDTFVPGLIRQNPPPKLGESRGMQSAHAFVLLYQACLPNPLTNFLSNRLAMQGNLNLLEDLPKVNGFYALNLREYEGIHNLLYSENSPEWPQLQKFLSASQITKPGTLFEWIPNTNFSPLITCGQRPVFTDSNPVQDLTNSSLDLSRIVLLPKSAKNFIQATNPAGGKIVTSTFKAHRITAETESDQPAWVVISQIFHRNWQAYVDGQPVPLWRANHAFQALEVPGGRHQVVLQYEDGSFRLGLVISLGTGLLLVLPMAYKPLRNRWLDRQDGNPVKAVV